MQAYEATGPSDEEIKKKTHQVSTPGQRVGFMGKLQAESLSTRAETKNLPMIELTPLYVSPPKKKKSLSASNEAMHMRKVILWGKFFMCNNLYP